MIINCVLTSVSKWWVFSHNVRSKRNWSIFVHIEIDIGVQGFSGNEGLPGPKGGKGEPGLSGPRGPKGRNSWDLFCAIRFQYDFHL